MKRIAQQLLTVFAFVALVASLAGCSGNTSVSTGIGIHRSPSGDWGHSISVGIHNHSLRW